MDGLGHLLNLVHGAHGSWCGPWVHWHGLALRRRVSSSAQGARKRRPHAIGFLVPIGNDIGIRLLSKRFAGVAKIGHAW